MAQSADILAGLAYYMDILAKGEASPLEEKTVLEEKEGKEVKEGKRGDGKLPVAPVAPVSPVPNVVYPSSVREREGSPEEVAEVLDNLRLENNGKGHEKKKWRRFERNICGGFYDDYCSNLGKHICKGCNVMQYCCRHCQKDHWPCHRFSCVKWRQVNTLTPWQAGELLTINMMVDHDLTNTLLVYWKYVQKNVLPAVVDFQAPGGLTPLMTCIKLERWREVRLLIECGASLDIKTEEGFTALMIAIISGGDYAIFNARLIIDAGADVNLQDNEGDSALIYAAMRGEVALVTDMIASKANVNIVGHLGFTAMMWAAQEGHDEVVRHLFNAGADVNMVNDEQQSAIYLAAKNGQTKVVKTLLLTNTNMDQATRSNETPLISAAGNGHIAIVTALIECGANLEFRRAHDGNTALTIAASNGHAETVHVMLKKGANIDNKDMVGATPLMWAASRGQFDVVDKLIEFKAELNCQNRFGWTALMMAAEEGSADVCLALLNAGADMNIKDKRGWNALAKATRETDAKHVQIAIYLLNKGCDVTVRVWGEGSIHDIAKAVNNTAVMRVIDGLSSEDVVKRMVGDSPSWY